MPDDEKKGAGLERALPGQSPAVPAGDVVKRQEQVLPAQPDGTYSYSRPGADVVRANAARVPLARKPRRDDDSIVNFLGIREPGKLIILYADGVRSTQRLVGDIIKNSRDSEVRELVGKGFHLVEATNGIDAMTCYQMQVDVGVPADLILLDAYLPSRQDQDRDPYGGSDLVRRLRQAEEGHMRAGRVPHKAYLVGVMPGRTARVKDPSEDQQTFPELHKAGAIDYLLRKPIDWEAQLHPLFLAYAQRNGRLGGK